MSNCRAFVSVVKTCQRCQLQFACGLSCCWCDEVKVLGGARAAIQRQFSDCLCRGCLETLAADRSTATSAFAVRAAAGD